MKSLKTWCDSMYAIMKDFECTFFTFVKNREISSAIRIALDQSEEGATWGSVNHMKVMAPGTLPAT